MNGLRICLPRRNMQTLLLAYINRHRATDSTVTTVPTSRTIKSLMVDSNEHIKPLSDVRMIDQDHWFTHPTKSSSDRKWEDPKIVHRGGVQQGSRCTWKWWGQVNMVWNISSWYFYRPISTMESSLLRVDFVGLTGLHFPRTLSSDRK